MDETAINWDSIPDVITKDQLYQICHISKSTALYLLRSGNAATLLVSGRDVEYQELTVQFNDLVWELVERKNSEDIHKAELPKFLFWVVDFIWITSPRSPRQM